MTPHGQGSAPQGPFVSTACKLPADVPQVAKDTQAYFEAGKASPALEFLSPIKGPALEQITVQVGTGQVTGQGGRGALRPGRQEAGPAARLAGLGVSRTVDGPERSRWALGLKSTPAAGLVRDRRQDHDPRKGFAMASTLSTPRRPLAPAERGVKERGKKRPGPYPYWFYLLRRDSSTSSSSSFPRSPRSTTPSPAGTCSPRPGSGSTTTGRSSRSRR